MKIKRPVILLIVLAVSVAFVGCNAINEAFDSVFMNATEVKEADLTDYDTSYSAASGEADVETGFELALDALGSQGSALASRMFGTDTDEALAILRYSSPEMAVLLGNSQPDSRQVNAGVNVSITDETRKDGVATIEISNADFSGNLEMDRIESPTSVKVDFKGKAEIGMSEISDYDYIYGNYTIADAQLNFNANGNAETTIGELGPTSINYYLGFDLSLGFSLECEGYSGKYIVNVKYVNSANWKTGSSSIAGGESINVVVTAYDNNGTVLGTKTYSAEEFFYVVASSVPSST